MRYILCMTSRRFILALVIPCFCAGVALAHPQASGDDAAAQYSDAGQQALAHGRYAEAQADFEKLAQLDPGIAEVHATLAAIDFKQREYDAAVREVRTALRLKPSLPRLDSLLGLSLSELSRYSEAIPYLEKGFRQTADSETRRMCGLQLLRAYTGLGRDADAVEKSLSLNRLYPDDPEVLYHTGRIYGNYAYIVMEKLHDKAPGSVWMLQAQGEANESQKNYDAAIVAFNHVLTIDPRRPGIHYRLGRVYLARFTEGQKAEDRDAAQREFAAELAIDPDNGNARYELANTAAGRGDLEEAHKQFEEVLKRYPDFEEALVGLGGVDLESENAQAAVPLLQRATEINPEDEVAWYRLSQAERTTGDKDGQAKALAAFRTLHSSTPVTLRRPDQENEVTPQQIDANAKP